MREIKSILVLLVFLLTASAAYTQKNHIRLAEKRFENHNYYGAATAWQKAFEKTENRNEKRLLAYQIARAYHLMNQFDTAIQWYADAIGEGTVKSEWYLHYSDALQRAGKQEEALSAAQQAARLNPRSARARDMIDHIGKLEQQQSVTNISLYEAFGVNSNYIDYAPAWMGSDLVFASTRRQGLPGQLDGRSAQGFSSLYMAKADLSGDYQNPVHMRFRGNTNTGAFSWDARQSRGFWTRCNNRKERCVIMEAYYDASNDQWSRPKIASFVQRQYHHGHPFMSEDGNWLYFVSDMPGGYGGKDLYKVSAKSDGSWGIPINLGQPVNTAADELFPSKAGDSLLFFSSSGHNGYGGLNILYSFNRSGHYEEVSLLPSPFNSFADDFGLLMQAGTTSGAMVSNRTSESHDDIYFFDVYPIRIILETEVRYADSRQAVDSAMLRFQVPREELYHALTNHKGLALISVPAFGQGSVSVHHPGYYPETKIYTITNEALKEKRVKVSFLLKKSTHYATISGLVTERETGEVLPGEGVELTGPGGLNLHAQTNQAGIYQFESLQPDNIYTVKVKKEGYFTESRVIRIPEIDQSAVFNKAAGYDMDFQLLQIQEKREIVINNIYYDFDKASLRADSKTELNKLVSMLRETPNVKVQINAHTDARGTHAYNDRLSQARARSVTEYLIAHGIHPHRLISRGHGKRALLIPNARTEAEHQANRRTTFQVTGIDYVSSPEEYLPGSGQKLSYRIQLLASANRYDPEAYFSALKATVRNIRFFVHSAPGLFRYEAGERFNLSEAALLRNQIRAAGFTDSFIVPYYDGKRISMEEAKQLQP